jgi:hypothetical protein
MELAKESQAHEGRRMTTFRYSIEIGDAAGRHFERVDAWVATGVNHTLAPVVFNLLGLAAEKP